MSVIEPESVPKPGGLSLDQLIALNDEIAALLRAGLPLERGLRNAGSDMPGKLGRVSRGLADRIERGESLSEAVAAEGSHFPPVYRAVVDAGIRSGKLSAALEGLAVYARNYSEMRRAFGLALMYPLIVALLAFVLVVGFLIGIVPRFLFAYQLLDIPESRLLRVFDRVGQYAVYWGPIVPICLVIFGISWLWSGFARAFPGGDLVLRRIPWMSKMFANSRAANFADILALLVDHGYPLADAIVLSAEASAERRFVRDAEAVAARVRAGDGLPDALGQCRSFPPLLRWLIAAGYRQGLLVQALRHASETYRRRALNQAEAIRTFLPAAFLVLIGATATVLFTVLVFLPFARMLKQLALG